MTDPRPLLVTADPSLIDAILVIAGAAGVLVDVAADLKGARQRWSRAACILLGADVRPGPVMPPRPDVVMVSGELDDATVWARAAQLKCEHVVFVPDADAWLETRLRRAVGGSSSAAPVVAVLGGRGGAGASVIASALGYTAARTGWHAALIDADVQGGSLELLFSDDGTPLAGPAEPKGAFRGRLDLMVRDRAAPEASERLGGFVEEVALGQDLVVVDLPRGDRERCHQVLSVARTTLLVVTPDVRSIVGAHAQADWARARCSDVRVVVRVAEHTTIEPEVVTSSLSLPVAGVLPSEKGLQGDLDRGVPPGRRRGHLRRWAEDFLAELGDPSSMRLVS